MNIRVEPYRCVIGDAAGTPDSSWYNFPSCERLSDGSFFITARKIRGLQDAKGGAVSVRYRAETGEITPAVSPACRDMAAYPEKGIYMCHVTELEPGHLVAVYPLIDCDPDLPLFDAQYDGIQPCRCRIVHSHDNGETWNAPQDLTYSLPDVIIPYKIQQLRQGTVGFPMEMHNHYQRPYIEPLQGRFLYSESGGENFERAALFPHAPGILAGDARCTVDGAGKLTVFFWAFDMENTRDLPVHRTTSTDGGRTFSPLEATSLRQQITSPFWVEGDTYLCIYQDRFSDTPGIKAALSQDGGLTWDEARAAPLFRCESRPDSANPFAAFEQFQFGYSSLTRIHDRCALATFWHTNGVTSCISACRIFIED